MKKATYDYRGRVVIVTGANGNLGSAVALAFAGAGADLMLVGRRQSRVKEALPDLVERERVMVAPDTDLTETIAVEEMVDAALVRFGRIDVLANTVGGYRGGTPIHKMKDKAWEFMMALNAKTAFLISRAVIPTMLESGNGKIIHTASRAAIQGSRGAGSYAASKAAVVNLTDTLAAELKDKGINVNCVLPGTIDTPENRQAMPSADHSRWVAPPAIARIFLFLASDDAKPLHGAHLPAYGLS